MNPVDEILALESFADTLEIEICQCRGRQLLGKPVDLKRYVKVCEMRSDCLSARNRLWAFTK